MGDELIPEVEPAAVRRFTKALLTDLQALERMIAEDRIEADIRRIGAEQPRHRPAVRSHSRPALPPRLGRQTRPVHRQRRCDAPHR